MFRHSWVGLVGAAPFLEPLLRCGGNNIPFPPVKPFMQRLSKELSSETMYLQRILTWHACLRIEVNPVCPPFKQLPYKRLFVSKGTLPPGRVEERFGYKFVCIERAITKPGRVLRLGLTHISGGPKISQGVSFSWERLGR